MHSYLNDTTRPSKCRKCGREAPLWSVHTDEHSRKGELLGSALCFACLPPEYKQRVEQDQKEKK